jgi:diaminohydroxyphosphoribosylaminopyrimidine deaminase / 5-amino-6-(5-phosphoribosylamino)uracil reductase|uniref:bifunctional diaminohydroxyphosphoribosylaminopyrimidine deaminase/5-amino-6-(5-phosphoribosylamino)uracil reductase RibD n=1 Tax=Candidatus Planktophila sp. TaxID=2175601 RepID=UPI00404A4993
MDYTVAMQRAIALSLKGLGKTSPNPIVGAVIVNSDGQVVGEGFHDRMSSPDHAEVVALKAAGVKAKGATMVVTLEPCNHTGATGPCSKAIADAGISKVFYAVKDPNKKAAGGAQALRDQGVQVESGVLESDAAYANRAWLTKIEKNRPFFTWKVATTLDGKIASLDGSSKWISNEKSRNDVQILRRQADAILVGTNTVITDDPHLIPRGDFPGFTANPLRVVCGEQHLPPTSKVFDEAATTLLVKTKDLNTLIEELNKTGANQVLVEAGPTLATAMLKHGLLDELVIYQAPSLLGQGKSFVADFGATTIKELLTLDHIASEVLDGDVKSTYALGKAK